MSKGDSQRDSASAEVRLSPASVNRLSLYLRCAESLLREGKTKVSSGQLGQALGVADTQVRKDLTSVGALGRSGIGYGTEELIAGIRRVLGIDREWPAVLVGVGNLARALLRYRGFQQQGFRFVALFDSDPAVVGKRVEGLQVQPVQQIGSVVAASGAKLGLITVPAEAAQAVADTLVEAGIRGILNFAPTVLRLPPGISLVAVNLAVQLEHLAFLVQMGGDSPSGS